MRRTASAAFGLSTGFWPQGQSTESTPRSRLPRIFAPLGRARTSCPAEATYGSSPSGWPWGHSTPFARSTRCPASARKATAAIDPSYARVARCMTPLAGAPERAGRECDLPTDRGQDAAERAGDLRRAAAREEEERRDDATARTPRLRAAASPPAPACTRARHREPFSPGEAAPPEMEPPRCRFAGTSSSSRG